MRIPIAMLFYEHGITLGDEIDHIWKRRWTGATLLFMLNRYATLLKSILGFFTLFNYDPHVSRLWLSQLAELIRIV